MVKQNLMQSMMVVATIHFCWLGTIFREIYVIFIYFSVVMIVVVVSEVVGLNEVCVGRMMHMYAIWDRFVGLRRLVLMMVCMSMCMSMLSTFVCMSMLVSVTMVMKMVVSANITMVVA